MSVILSELAVVNSTTAEDQQAPAITALALGGWLVTWESYIQDTSGLGIYQQRFDSNGMALGNEVRVNTKITDDQSNSAVTALADGGWVVTWESYAQDGEYAGIYQQRYDNTGAKNGLEVKVNTVTLQDQNLPSVAALGNGGWVVTWQSNAQDGSEFGIYQQPYKADGTKMDLETRVNATVAGAQINATVTGLNDGGWIVTWQSADQDGYEFGIYQQRYNAAGVKSGGEIQVNTATAYDQSQPVIAALPSGGWVVTWQTFDDDLQVFSLHQQAYDIAGAPVGAETQVSTFGAGGEMGQSLTPVPGGGWVVVWCQDGDIVQRIFDASGEASGGAVVIGTGADYFTTTGVAQMADGGWVVTWQAYNEFGDLDIIQRQVHTVDNEEPSGADKTIEVLEGEGHTFVLEDFGFSDGNQSDSLQAVIITAIGGAGYLTRSQFDEDLEQTVSIIIHVGDSVMAEDIATLEWVPVDNSPGDAVGIIGFQVVDTGGTANGGQNTDQTPNTITFDIRHVNQAPSGTDKLISLNNDATHVFAEKDFGFTDNDGNAFAAIVIDTLPLFGELRLNNVAVQGGQMIAASDIPGLIWTPPATGEGKATFAFRVKDAGNTENGGSNLEATPHAMTMAFAAHHAPAGADFEMTGKEDSGFHFSAGHFSFSDEDGDSLAGILISKVPSTGTLKLNGDNVGEGTTIALTDLPGLVWRPEKNSFGDALDSLEFQVVDNGSLDNGGANTDATPNLITFNVTGVTDFIIGTSRNNTLDGTDGDDIVIGKKGSDKLAGHAGADTFVFFNKDGRDTVLDFQATEVGHDIVDVSEIRAIRGFHDLLGNHMHQAGANVVIDHIGKGHSIKLLNVDMADLDAGDFLF